MNDVRIQLADLSDDHQAQDVLAMINHYACSSMGQGKPLAQDIQARLIPGLRQQPNARIFLAYRGSEPIGIAVTFLVFSTFRAKQIINIHDLSVHADHQGKGIGRKLLDHVKRFAQEQGCGSMTLEVRVDNWPARKLYDSFGFQKVGTELPDDYELFARLPLDPPAA
jgi:ribosomal protein S18 acetylase RimI-like enzyme